MRRPFSQRHLVALADPLAEPTGIYRPPYYRHAGMIASVIAVVMPPQSGPYWVAGSACYAGHEAVEVASLDDDAFEILANVCRRQLRCVGSGERSMATEGAWLLETIKLSAGEWRVLDELSANVRMAS